ncbi:hypothetical protein PINS_up023555 [Pythium insidiosum]|nr:hypothetical protein PINS_up023555 [Pythium insidiosum]
MASRSLQKLTNQATYYAKEASGFGTRPFCTRLGCPCRARRRLDGLARSDAGVQGGDARIKATPAPGSAAATAAMSSVFSASGKYKFVRNEIGERPTLAGADDEDEDDE